MAMHSADLLAAAPASPVSTLTSRPTSPQDPWEKRRAFDSIEDKRRGPATFEQSRLEIRRPAHIAWQQDGVDKPLERIHTYLTPSLMNANTAPRFLGLMFAHLHNESNRKNEWPLTTLKSHADALCEWETLVSEARFKTQSFVLDPDSAFEWIHKISRRLFQSETERVVTPYYLTPRAMRADADGNLFFRFDPKHLPSATGEHAWFEPLAYFALQSQWTVDQSVQLFAAYVAERQAPGMQWLQTEGQEHTLRSFVLDAYFLTNLGPLTHLLQAACHPKAPAFFFGAESSLSLRRLRPLLPSFQLHVHEHGRQKTAPRVNEGRPFDAETNACVELEIRRV